MNAGPDGQVGGELPLLTVNIGNPPPARAERQLQWLARHGAAILVLTETKASAGCAMLREAFTAAGYMVAGDQPPLGGYGTMIVSRLPAQPDPWARTIACLPEQATAGGNCPAAASRTVRAPRPPRSGKSPRKPGTCPARSARSCGCVNHDSATKATTTTVSTRSTSPGSTGHTPAAGHRPGRRTRRPPSSANDGGPWTNYGTQKASGSSLSSSPPCSQPCWRAASAASLNSTKTPGRWRPYRPAPIEVVARCVPRALGRLAPADARTSRLTGSTGNPYWYAEQLAKLPVPFRVVGGVELREITRALGERLLAASAHRSARA